MSLFLKAPQFLGNGTKQKRGLKEKEVCVTGGVSFLGFNRADGVREAGAERPSMNSIVMASVVFFYNIILTYLCFSLKRRPCRRVGGLAGDVSYS